MTTALLAEKVNSMDGNSMRNVLANAGIPCYDEETEGDLRKSILYRIKTGELQPEDLIAELV